eukprot:SAG11_NODE_1369_length_5094_cov_5.116070_2_plen_100_part_00
MFPHIFTISAQCGTDTRVPGILVRFQPVGRHVCGRPQRMFLRISGPCRVYFFQKDPGKKKKLNKIGQVSRFESIQGYIDTIQVHSNLGRHYYFVPHSTY